MNFIFAFFYMVYESIYGFFRCCKKRKPRRKNKPQAVMRITTRGMLALPRFCPVADPDEVPKKKKKADIQPRIQCDCGSLMDFSVPLYKKIQHIAHMNF